MLSKTLFALNGHMDIVMSRGSIIPEEEEDEEECEGGGLGGEYDDQQEPQSAQQSERNNHGNDMVYMQGLDQEIVSLQINNNNIINEDQNSSPEFYK